MKLDAVKFGAAFGVVYAVIFFLYGLIAALSGWGHGFTIGSLPDTSAMFGNWMV